MENILNDKDKTPYDGHLGKQPSAVLSLAIRLVLLCLLSASFFLMICDLYEYTGNKWELAGLAAAAAGLTFTLASVLPTGLVYGAEILAAAVPVWLARDKVMHDLRNFWDFMMLRLDSRLIDTTRFFAGDPDKIKSGTAAVTAQLEASFRVVMLILIVLMAVMFTSAVRTRFHLVPPTTAAVIAVAPAVAAERAGYVPSFFMYVVCIFGFIIINSSHDADMTFTFGKHLGPVKMNLYRQDLLYFRRTRFTLFGKKIRQDSERFHAYTANSAALALLAAAVFFGIASTIPEGKGLSYKEVFQVIENITYRAADTVSGFLGTTFGTTDDKGYFSEGGYNDLSSSISIAPPSSSDRPVLEVTLSRSDIPVYLRGDIGVEYRGNAWTGVKTVDRRYRELVPEDFYPENEYQMFRKYLAYTFSADFPDSVLPLNMVSLRYLRNTRVIFQPLAAFELNYRENEQYECFSDFILRTRRGFVKNYNTLSLTPNFDSYADLVFTDSSGSPRYMPAYYADGTIDPPEGMTGEEYSAAITAYGDYIYETYLISVPAVKEMTESLDIPQSYIGYAQNRYDAYSGYYRYEIAIKINDYFARHFTYALDTDNGFDQLSGFLYDTHSGHCALFASAMTLALREYGIPARYVTGYVAEGAGEEVKEGYKYTLTEKQLHAWVEVYFDGIGWLPFDPTLAVPGYSEVMSGEWDGTGEHDYGDQTGAEEKKPPETVPPETSTAPDITVPPVTSSPEEPDADTTAEPDAAPVLPGDGSGGGTGRSSPDIFVVLLPVLVTIAVIGAFAAVTAMFAASLKRGEREVFRGFKKLPPTEASALMYRFVLTLLAKKGLVPDYEQFYDFAQRVDGSIELKGANVFMMDVMPVFEKCEFGNAAVSPVTEDERAAVYRFTVEVYRKIMSDYSSMKRFFVKISLFL